MSWELQASSELFSTTEITFDPLLSSDYNHSRKYRSLAPRTRVLIGVGIMGYAGLGLLLSDTAEEKFGLVPTEKDKEELDRIIPKIKLVDRDDTLTKGDS